MAPFTPFLSEELYSQLTGRESVHLEFWPAGGHVNDKVLTDMAFAREVINQGLSQRAAARLKVRQPLAVVRVVDQQGRLDDELCAVVADELNVKEVRMVAEGAPVDLDIKVTPTLKREGLARDVVRLVQTARKAAGLQVDDRIELALVTSDQELTAAIDEHRDTIKAETLAAKLVTDELLANLTEVTLEGAPLAISLRVSDKH